ncbi:putative DTW domain-containing protein DTWD2/YfiP [Helianthus annuus]|nr:putative DTW domain-containing protein DTWD2/YfiP [Helianthus annuus]KAJ0816030.1 putative DTW domain-containing protein DTWD2/YfiP [Helianthus annuus]
MVHSLSQVVRCTMVSWLIMYVGLECRPQPSWDRTCTAGAAVGLLDELHLVSQFNSLGLDKQAEAVENSVDVLLASLTGRRLRMGRSVTRRQRHHDDFC